MSAASKYMSKTRFCQGEIFYIMPEGEESDSDTFYGGRPGIIITTDMINEYKNTVGIIYLTTHPRDSLPTNIPISETNRKSWAICDQIDTVSKKRIGKYVGQCSPGEMNEIAKALAIGYINGINEFNNKEIQEALNIWRENLCKSKDITEAPAEDFETADKPDSEPIAKPVTTKSKNSETADTVSNIENTSEYIKMQTERDTYKAMYEQLLSQILNK